MTWNFYDPVNGDDYDLEIGPSTVTYPRQRNVIYSVLDRTAGSIAMLAPDHRPLLNLQGALLSANQLAVFDDWFDKGRAIIITSPLGQQYTAMISKLERDRVRSFNAPNRHTWTISAYVFAAGLLPSDLLVPAEDLVPR